MQTNQTVTPRYPTHQDIQRGIAQGRRERSRAVSAMARSLVDFLIGRKLKYMTGGRRIAPRAC